MRLNPETLTVETFATHDDMPEKVGHASSDTRYRDCSGACIVPSCVYQACY
jgi:hypothetical protein